jgi:hypothetical protein
MICYKDEKATIAYLEAEQAIACSWEGDVPSAQFQQVMQLKLQHLQAFSAKNWMMDIRHMKAIAFDDQQWLWDGGWIQSFLRLPIRKVAIIQSYDVYNAMVIEVFLRYVSEHGACEVQLFADFEASLAWIRDFSASSFELRTGTC